jgi:hypothetical protein
VQFARHLWNSDNSKAEQAFSLIERINCVEKFLLEGEYNVLAVLAALGDL